MQQLVTTMPGLKTNEYLLVILPHQPLRERIQKLKTDFGVQFKNTQAVSSRVHLPLVRFTQQEMVEEKILHRLHCIAMAQAPFKVDIKDFGSYPSHSVFINIAAGKIALQQLVKTIRTEAQRLLKLDAEHKPFFAPDPNFTLGTKLLPWQYEAASKYYAQKHFSAAFIADGMLLLKRPAGQLNYEVLQHFAFEHLPVRTTQGALF